MRAAPTSIRFALAALVALLMAVRSLAPQGFMPAFEHGSVTIVVCPDGGATAQAALHHRHPAGHDGTHQPCPYAAASWAGALGPDWAPLPLSAFFFAAALLLGRTFQLIERQSSRERPPAIGPPIPA